MPAAAIPATATEAAALGVAGSLILAAWQRTLSMDSFTGSVLGAIRTNAMIMFILMGSGFLSLAMGFTGGERNFAIAKIDQTERGQVFDHGVS